MLRSASFFDLAGFAHPAIFSGDDYVWEALRRLKEYMRDFPYPERMAGLPANRPLPETLIYYADSLTPATEATRIEYGDTTKGGLKVWEDNRLLDGASVLMAGAVLDGGPMKIGKGVMIEPGAMIKGLTIVGDHTEIRQGAYLRGFCLIGDRCVLGHVTEIKHSIFLNDAKAGHFAYLGDSILGNEVNLGAGTKMANLRFTGGEVPIRTEQGTISSGLRKFGAILGDRVQTGCNSVTNPGTLLGRGSMVMPNTTVPSGYHPKGTLVRG